MKYPEEEGHAWSETLSTVTQLFADLGLSPNETIAAALDRGEIDSLSLVELVVIVEERTGVPLTMDDVITCAGAADLAALVASRGRRAAGG
jgi:acyl carrier protein